MLDGARANLGDHHAERAAAQRFFHRPEHIAHAWGRNRDQVFRSNAGLIESWSVKLSVFAKREIFGNPEHGLRDG